MKILALLFLVCGGLMVFVLNHYSRTVKRTWKRKPITDIYQSAQKSTNYCPLNKISYALPVVIVALEDEHYWKHKGMDWKKLFCSLWINLWSGKRKMGGSTITQQLAKNVYFTDSHSIGRKIAEIFMVREIEKALTKEQILELYFHVIYYGHGLYGIQKACDYYFHESVENLSFNQAITIGTILPSPENYSPLREGGLFAKAKENAVKRLCESGILDLNDAEYFLQLNYDAVEEEKIRLRYNTRHRKES